MLQRLALGVGLMALGACLTLPWILAGCNSGVESAHVTGVEPNAEGVYDENPFEPDLEPPFPAIEVPERTFEFGKMPIGEERSHTFVIRNIGEVPVRLAMGPSTCQCTLGKLQDELLQPGEETDVMLTWTPNLHTPEFAKGAAIWTDIPEMQKIEFTIRGKVVPELGLVPGEVWSAGMVQDGVQTQLSGLIYSLMDPNFEVLGIDVSDEWLQVRHYEAEDSAVRTLNGEKGYHLICEVLPSCPLGEFRGVVTIHTNMENADYKEMVMMVSGSRAGPFSITGRGWKADTYGTLEIGDVTAGEAHSTELSLVTTPFDEPLEMSIVEADPEFLGFELRRDDAYPVTSRERYYLTFSVPADAPLGEWTGDNAGTVKLRTNIPDREELNIRVHFSVR